MVTRHVKHAHGPYEPTDLIHGNFNVSGVAPSPNHLSLSALHTPHSPSLSDEATIAYPPYACTTAPRPQCQHHLKHGPSQPIITVHGVDTVLPRFHTPDEATHTGSLSSKEGNLASWIPPAAGGVQHPGYPGCFSRYGVELYRTTLQFPAGAIPRLEAGSRGSMLRRDDRYKLSPPMG